MYFGNSCLQSKEWQGKEQKQLESCWKSSEKSRERVHSTSSRSNKTNGENKQTRNLENLSRINKIWWLIEFGARMEGVEKMRTINIYTHLVVKLNVGISCPSECKYYLSSFSPPFYRGGGVQFWEQNGIRLKTWLSLNPHVGT